MKRTVTLRMPVEVEIDVQLSGVDVVVASATPSQTLKLMPEQLVELNDQLAYQPSELTYEHIEGTKSIRTAFLIDLLKEVDEVIHYACRAFSGKEHLPVCGANSTRTTDNIAGLFHELGNGNGACQACIDDVQRAVKASEDRREQDKAESQTKA